MKIAIQGGPGSFNEETARKYIGENNLAAEVDYCFTSSRVVEALACGEAEQGLMAIENSVGGVVYESIEALAEGSCRIVAYLDILVVHALLVPPGVTREEIGKIISHPQALKQCERTLAEEFPDTPTEAGEGELLDQATAAKALAAGELPQTSAVLASRVCAELYDLDILAEGLQDSDENLTTFVVVEEK